MEASEQLLTTCFAPKKSPSLPPRTKKSNPDHSDHRLVTILTDWATSVPMLSGNQMEIFITQSPKTLSESKPFWKSPARLWYVKMMMQNYKDLTWTEKLWRSHVTKSQYSKSDCLELAKKFTTVSCKSGVKLSPPCTMVSNNSLWIQNTCVQLR